MISKHNNPPVCVYNPFFRVLDNNRRAARCFTTHTVLVQWSNFVDIDSFIKSYQVDFIMSGAGYDNMVKSVTRTGDVQEVR